MPFLSNCPVLYSYPSLPSTQTLAQMLASAGAAHGTVVLADQQTAGRGRAMRVWQTPAGSALAASWVLRPGSALAISQVGLFGMLGAWAVWQSCQQLYGLLPDLKWPNDVWLAGKKLAGILPTASFQGGQLDWVLLGIGVNLNGQPDSLGLPDNATTLSAQTGELCDRWQFLTCVSEYLAKGYAQWCAQPQQPAWLNTWRQYLLWRDQDVLVYEGERHLVSGQVHGITPQGALLLLVDGQLREVLFGELSVRLIDTDAKETH
jgi:BirA family biotin operon repressor/biotin-[acetyl-CoA-carboxylase] ligase